MNQPNPPLAIRPPGDTSLTFPFAQAPAGGTWQEVAPGVFWLRMPLPFALDHINLWVLRDGAGWTLVDTGLNSEATRRLWDEIVAEGLAGLPVRRVVVTHYHPDHFGLAGWLTQRFGVELWMTESEFVTAQVVFAQLPGHTNEASLALFARHGLDEERQEAVRNRKHSYHKAISEPPTTFRRMLDGDVLQIDGRQWRVIMGYGHAPEHAALYCEELGVLISGDMVLPKISTNVSVWASEPEGDPLELFLRSVQHYAELPAGTFVLPSHGLPFQGLRPRAAALREHHRLRLDELLAACDHPVSAADIVPVLFRRQLDNHQMVFAMGEAIAHLNHLLYQRRIVREAGPDGILRFMRASVS
jgi:glyoxylase-like metal-dependent hydrolase (beta-lactamase superfamily II)